MRVTTGMIAGQFSKSLNKSLESLNKYSNRATSWRRFDRVSENPLTATQAFRVRREYEQNADQLQSAEDIDSMMATAESALMTVNGLVQGVAYEDCIKAITDSMKDEDRAIVAKKLRQVQQSLVGTMNTQFGAQYLFAGANRSQPPFSVAADGTLLYKGVNVNTGERQPAAGVSATANISGTKIGFGGENGALLNGITLNVTTDKALASGYTVDAKTGERVLTVRIDEGATNDQLLAELQKAVKDEKDAGNAAFAAVDESKFTVTNGASTAFTGKTLVAGGVNEIVAGTGNSALLENMANEKAYVDLGLGIKFEGNNLVDISAFDASLPGLDFLGYGQNDAGVSNNLYTLMGQIADVLEGKDAPYSFDAVKPLLDNFESQYTKYLTKITDFGAKTSFLTSTKARLSDLQINLNTKLENLEYMDPAQAIMEFKQQEYSYHAALQMGTKIFLPTFLDFMS